MSRTFTWLVIFTALAAVGAAQAAYWDVEPVYTGGFASGDASVAADASNVPSVSYAANGGLFLATRQVPEWSSQFVAEVGFWGGLSSLRFNSADQPCISFIDASDMAANYLKYAYKASSSWTVETVDDVGWLPDRTALAFDENGRACIAYCKTVGSTPYVCFARRTGPNAWTKESVAAVGDVTGPAIAAASGGDIYIAFTDTASGELKIASKSGTAPWRVQSLDGSASSPAVSYTALALQPDGEPAVAYFVISSGAVSLRYARRSDGAWSKETAAGLAAGSPYWCALAVTPGGVPLIGCRDPSSDSFKNAWKSGGAWRTEDIDLSPGSGHYICYALDNQGNIDAAYFDSLGGNVRFAWAVIPRSTQEAKTLPDNEVVQISGVIASTAAADLDSALYVQEQDRSCGIKLRFTTPVPPVTRGMVLDVQGRLGMIGGERVINDPLLVEIGAFSAP